MKKYLVISALALLTLAGCGEDAHKSAPEVNCEVVDANGVKTCVDGSNVKIVQNPQGFRNVLVECYGTTGLYVTSRGDVLATPVGSDLEIYPNDPRCTNQATPKTTVSPSVPQ